MTKEPTDVLLIKCCFFIRQSNSYQSNKQAMKESQILVKLKIPTNFKDLF